MNQPPNDTCGFKSHFYDCGGNGENPNHPMLCPEICIPNCDGKECGNGGCENYPSDLCGRCDEAHTCIDGRCQKIGADNGLDIVEDASFVERQRDSITISEDATSDRGKPDVVEVSAPTSPKDKGSGGCSSTTRSSKDFFLLSLASLFGFLTYKKRRGFF